MIYDAEDLRLLDNQRNRTTYVRITSLHFDESPIESIEGRATGGSVNIDGSSAVRRTCQLTLVVDDPQRHDYHWGLNTKFKLEVGMKNYSVPTLPDIVWFPQGIFVITSFGISSTTNSFTVSITGKDKMCLLNGEVSGNLESQVDFGTIEEEDLDGIWVKRKIPIKDIIQNAVHAYGGEPAHNIEIRDLPEKGYELLEYRYDQPIYLYRQKSSNTFDNVLINDNKLCLVGDEDTSKIVPLKDLTPNQLEMLVDRLKGTNNPANIYFDDDTQPYHVAKVEYGQTAGYRKTDLVFAGDLVANAGETLTSILDKIKNMLGEFEYFYDVDGRFIFQQKRTYVELPWNPLQQDGMGEEMISNNNEIAYVFDDGVKITQFNNNPDLLNLKNDFVVRGERTGVSGSALPIIFRYAIDVKPTKYYSIPVSDEDPKLIEYNQKYNTNLKGQTRKSYTVSEYDWREIIYQMASDYYKYNWLDDFEWRVIEANKVEVSNGYGGTMVASLYPTGRTGYEQYYIDIISFWRELYYPQNIYEADLNKIKNEVNEVNNTIRDLEVKKNGDAENIGLEKLVLDAESALRNAEPGDAQTYYKALLQARSALADIQQQLTYWNGVKETYEAKQKSLEDKAELYYFSTDDKKEPNEGWNKNVIERPEVLNFWFDFLDATGDLAGISAKVIGSRTKVENDSNIKAIYYRNTPDILFVNNINNPDNDNTAFRYIQIPQSTMEEMFSISAQGKSAKTKIDELINKHSYCTESVSISNIPIYHLEVNTKVQLYDNDTNINGDYIVSKISLPLAYNGIMNLTATKAPPANII